MIIYIKSKKQYCTIALSFCVLFVAFSVTGCKKFIQTDPPVNMLAAATVFENDVQATGAQLSIYKDMFLDAPAFSAEFSYAADELKNYSRERILQSYYTNFFAGGTGEDWWRNGYRYIYRSNAVLEGLDASVAIVPAIKKQLRGEALFTRAYWHFTLANMFGAIPLVLTTDYQVNNFLFRTPKPDVLSQVIADLEEAKSLLNSGYVNEADTVIVASRVRPNSGSASALLARVYLYAQQYDSAETEAGAVINNPLYYLEPGLSNVFLGTSQEAIWQLDTPLPNSIQTQEGHSFILLTPPTSGASANCSTISNMLMDAFEATDQRKTAWINPLTVTNPAATFNFPFKYQVFDNNHNPNGRNELSTVLRLAEQYLIRAEARLLKASPDIAGAVADLDAIRNRAGLGNYTGATDKASLQAAILHERQVELFTEWGHRWFDLIRTGNANAVMSVVAPFKGGVWDPNGYQQLFPIPSNERKINSNLTQNPGYN